MPNWNLPRCNSAKKLIINFKTFLKHVPISSNVKLPKIIKRYCPYCKRHADHNVSQTKKKNPSSLSYGSKIRARKRGQARGKGNLGRYSKPAISKFKMTGKKSTKKTDLRYQCTICKKMHVQRQGFRAKKIEFT